MKTILLLVHDDPGQEARLQVALDLVRALEGHLTCLDVATFPLVAADFYGVGAAALVAEDRSAETANRARLEARLAHEDVSWSMIEATGELAPTVRQAAGLADLVITDRHDDGGFLPTIGGTIEEIILTSGRPVLAVPRTVRGIDLSGRALVCWDGSAPAQAALHASVPLLKLAAEVELLQILDRTVTAPAEGAAAYLARYGITARIIRRSKAAHVASAILAEAGQGHAYVVMGGFSHSRLREALFGGVTRTMLQQCPVPLLLAH